MSKSLGPIAFVDDSPVYSLVRHPHPENKQTNFEIWVEDNGIDISTNQLAQLLADTLQKVVKSAPKKVEDNE